MLVAVQVPLLVQPRAAHMPEPASDEGGDAPEQTQPLVYPCAEQSWRKMEKTVQAYLRAKKLPVSLFPLEGTHDSYSSPLLMRLFNPWRQGQQCTQVGSVLLGAGRKKCNGSVMSWAPVPLLGAKLGLLSLGWLQGEGRIGRLLPK